MMTEKYQVVFVNPGREQNICHSFQGGNHVHQLKVKSDQIVGGQHTVPGGLRWAFNFPIIGLELL